MSLTLEVHNEELPLKEPFRISGYTFQESPITLVTLRSDSCEGRGVIRASFRKVIQVIGKPQPDEWRVR